MSNLFYFFLVHLKNITLLCRSINNKNLNMKKIIFNLAFAGIAIFALASCSNDDDMIVMDNMSQEFETTAKSSQAPGDSSIAEIAIGAGFSELVAALAYVDAEMETGLVNMFLNGTDQYTVFAPNNEAFENLYASLDGVETITDLPSSLVYEVLLYHVVEGRRGSNSVVPKKNYKTIETLLGQTFKVDSDAMIMATGNNAQIIAADISASNGMVHVIDTVILHF